MKNKSMSKDNPIGLKKQDKKITTLGKKAVKNDSQIGNKQAAFNQASQAFFFQSTQKKDKIRLFSSSPINQMNDSQSQKNSLFKKAGFPFLNKEKQEIESKLNSKSLNTSDILNKNSSQSSSFESSMVKDQIFIQSLLQQIKQSEQNVSQELGQESQMGFSKNTNFLLGKSNFDKSFQSSNRSLNQSKQQLTNQNSFLEIKLNSDMKELIQFNFQPSKSFSQSIKKKLIETSVLKTNKKDQSNTYQNAFLNQYENEKQNRNDFIKDAKEKMQSQFKSFNPQFSKNLSSINIMKLKECEDPDEEKPEILIKRKGERGSLDSKTNTQSSIPKLASVDSLAKDIKNKAPNSNSSRNSSRRAAIKDYLFLDSSISKEKLKREQKSKLNRAIFEKDQTQETYQINGEINQYIDRNYQFKTKTLAQNKLPLPK